MAAVADEPRHGYGILGEIDVITSGEVTPQVATLYRTIERLAGDGLLVEHDSEVVDGRFRRSYRLTESGVVKLAAEAKLRAATARVASKRLRLRSAHPGLAGGAA